MTPILGREDLAEALRQPRALLFLWVAWAVQARSSERTVMPLRGTRPHEMRASTPGLSRGIFRGTLGALLGAWRDASLEPVIPCYRADVGDQGGEVWDALHDWMTAEQQPASQLLLSGTGPLLWLRSGRVVACTVNPNRLEPDELLRVSRHAFAPAADLAPESAGSP